MEIPPSDIPPTFATTDTNHVSETHSATPNAEDIAEDAMKQLRPMVLRHWRSTRIARRTFDYAGIGLRTLINRLPRADHRDPVIKLLDKIAGQLGDLEADIVQMSRVTGCDDKLREQLQAMND